MKARIKFSKQGNMKFIGHLDLMRYFQKAMRRADVDIRYSEGFSPHQIMSFAAPLGVGLTGSGEYMDIEVLSSASSKEMARRLNAAMVEGVEVLSFKALPDDAANAMSLVAACDYTIRLREGAEAYFSLPAADFFAGLEDFIQTGDLSIVKKTKKGEKQVDLRPLIYESRLVEEGQGIFLKLSSGSAANMKPEQLLEAFCKSMGKEFPAFLFWINREEIYADKGSAPAHDFVPLEEFGEDIE